MSEAKPCWSCRELFSPELLDSYAALAHLGDREVKLCPACAMDHLRNEKLPVEYAEKKTAVQVIEAALNDAGSAPGDAKASAWALRLLKTPKVKRVLLEILKREEFEAGGAA